MIIHFRTSVYNASYNIIDTNKDYNSYVLFTEGCFISSITVLPEGPAMISLPY